MKNKYTENYDFQLLVQSELAGSLDAAGKESLTAILNEDMDAQMEYAFSEGLTKVLKNQDLFLVSGIIKGLIDTEALPDMDNDAGSPSLPPQRGGVNYVKNWFWVSCMALVIGLGFLGLWQYRNATVADQNKQLVQQYIKPLEVNLFTTTPRQGIQNLDEGMKAYEAGDYVKGSSLLRKYYMQTKDVNAGLYLAIATLLNNGSTQEAEQLLNEIIPQLSEPVKEEAEWYLILTKLTANEREAAQLMLEKLPTSHIHKKEADKLLQQMR